MLFSFAALSLALSALPSVLGHGFISEATFDGKLFKGNFPGQAPQDSIIRQITDPSPVKGADNPSINCGPGAPNAALVAKVNPGAKVSLLWVGGDNSNWPHNNGGVFRYLASCGDTPCNQFDTRNAQWFKISESLRDGSGNWVQATFMNRATSDFNLPANLAPGGYILREEIIALHIASSPGGAEFYPSCIQIEVTGNGNGRPQNSELVKLPGAYKDTDPGILLNTQFDPNAPYTSPGPKVAAFVNGGASGSGTNSGNGSGSNTGKPKPTKSSASSPAANPTATGEPEPVNNGAGSTGSCTLVKKKRSQSKRSVHRPRRVSRVMRGINVNTH